MQRMRKGGPAVDGVRYTNIVTMYDQLVVPYTSGIQRGMRNFVLQEQCNLDLSEHFQVVASPVVARIVLNTLDPRHRRPVPCTPVLPFVGLPG
jgi:triacylglycerol lipase